MILFTDYCGIEQKDGVGSKWFSYSDMRIFFNICLKWHLDLNRCCDSSCYGSGDVLLNAARHENVVKVANSGTLRLINTYL